MCVKQSLEPVSITFGKQARVVEVRGGDGEDGQVLLQTSNY